MILRIVAASHHYRPVGDSVALPSLEAEVAAVTRRHARRIDRFVQLALVGAGACVRGHTLAPDCGLYLSSGFGPVGSNTVVKDALHRERRLPMPFSFINTLGSSACFHVAAELGLTGESIVVARRRGSFTAALQCALTDLVAGAASQALVGAVEECILPAKRQLALLREEEGTVLAEGSHWLLLEPAEVGVDATSVEATPVPEAPPDAFAGYESAEAARLTAAVLAASEHTFHLILTDAGDVRLLTHAPGR